MYYWRSPPQRQPSAGSAGLTHRLYQVQASLPPGALTSLVSEDEIGRTGKLFPRSIIYLRNARRRAGGVRARCVPSRGRSKSPIHRLWNNRGRRSQSSRRCPRCIRYAKVSNCKSPLLNRKSVTCRVRQILMGVEETVCRFLQASSSTFRVSANRNEDAP
jgi:hypothetical protein